MNDQPHEAKFDQKSRLQIKHLFWATALFAAGMGIDAGTIFLSIIVIVAWLLTFWMKKRGCAFAIAIMLFLLWFGAMLPAVSQVRDAARRSMCLNNMRQLSLAILNYEAAFGHFPTDTIEVDENGKEIRTSWRAHVLPFTELHSIGDSYRFDEPWNSPNNLALQQQVDQIGWFSCPSHNTPQKTPYKLVVGKGTAFETGKQICLNDCKDRGHNIVALVEDIQNPVNLFEPKDLSPEEATALFNGVTRDSSAHYHETLFTKRYVGFHFGLLDGSVRTWPAVPKNKIDKGAFLIADGVLFEPSTKSLELVDLMWGRIVSLAVYIVLCIYPTVWLYSMKRSY